MVYISKVYTKFGDDGQTMLASGVTVSKNSPRVRAYGEVDELNATLGMVRLELGREPRGKEHAEFVATLDDQLVRIQQELFNLGAELATPETAEGGSQLRVEQRHIDALEKSIDHYNASLEPLRSFILPGGGPTGSAAHVARTVCRRAERVVIGLTTSEPVRREAHVYLNRLSDWLFVIARAAAKNLGHAEVLWDPRRT